MKKSIYDLELNEIIDYGFKKIIQRVPGGWIYHYPNTAVFVPFNKEFQTKEPLQKEIKIKLSITQRKDQFEQSLSKYINIYGDVMIVEFIDYWTEYGEGDSKMRFEKETSFSLSRRLSTWKKRSKSINNPSTQSVNDKWKK